MNAPETEDLVSVFTYRTRLLWGAMLMGQVAFLVVLVVLILQGMQGYVTDAGTAQNLLYISSGVMIFGALVGYFLRMQIYKAGWENDHVKPDAYFMGNLILFATLETVSLVALVSVLLVAQLIPFALPALVALILMAVNFPSSSPMRPSPIGNLVQ